MPLFNSKIDTFSSFTINLGPLYLERLFDSLLIRQGMKAVGKMSTPERLKAYLGYLDQKNSARNKLQCIVIQFYKGHFHHQLATYVQNQQDTQDFQEKALCYYLSYLELSKRLDESFYYTTWQVGMLLDTLKYPWSLAEKALLNAMIIDPLRGEPIKKIIEHYVHHKDWTAAHSYSKVAVKRYFDNNPIAHRRWFINFDAYNWNVLNTHFTICYKLGYWEEAKNVHNQMLSNGSGSLSGFKNYEIRHIHTLKHLLPSQKTDPIITQ